MPNEMDLTGSAHKLVPIATMHRQWVTFIYKYILLLLRECLKIRIITIKYVHVCVFKFKHCYWLTLEDDV